MITPTQNWRRVTELFEQALERSPDKRAAFLKSACAGDDVLLREVESLLAEHDADTGFLESPAVAAVADEIGEKGEQPRIGKQLGHYRIEAMLGRGGMGEVYLAQDKLGRKVALKILTQRFPGDESGIARFQQEARTLLALNHPHIVTIHDIDEIEGVYYIASELVEGATLRERLDEGDMPLQDLLEISIQVAMALAAAHKKGVIHRDIKPENIMIRRDGFVKVLDFGIAKLTEKYSTGESEAPTLKQIHTAEGTVVGTAPYMSPEQARGLKVDARTDIWSLGVVIYEAVAGRKPFSGDTSADVINSVIEKTPAPMSRYASEVPEALEWIVSRALRKAKEARYQTANELLTDLKELRTKIEIAKVSGEVTGGAAVSPPAPTRDPRTIAAPAASTHVSSAEYITTEIKRHKLAFMVGFLVLAAGIVFGLYWLTTQRRPSNRTVASIPFGEMDISRFTTFGKTTHAAISPDGKYVAHVTVDADRNSLWVRHVGAPSNVRIAGPATTEYISVVFAPDGNRIYYIALDHDKGESTLYRVPVLGGPSSILAHDIYPVGFSPDGQQIAFIRMHGSESHLVVADIDGANQRVVAKRYKPDFFEMEWNAPAWSPDRKTIVCPIGLNDQHGHYETIISVSAADGTQAPLTSARWNYVGQPVWLTDGSGLLLTASDRPGSPRQVWHVSLQGGVATRITHDLNNYYDLSLTGDASRLTAVQVQEVSNIWVAPEADAGSARQISSEIGSLEVLAWTSDGQIVYRSSAGGEGADIWVMKADGSNAKQLTVGARAHHGVTVTPDGRHIIFVSDRAGQLNLWRVDTDGGNLRQLTAGDGEFYPQCTPDGQWVVFQSGYIDARLWKVPTEGGEPVQLTKTRATRPAVSPDGQMIAYSYLDVELDPRRWGIGIVSSEGGERLKRFDFPPTVSYRHVRWSNDGQSIAFLNSRSGLSNIWLQPLDGSPPRQLTNFKAERIIAFDWSPDGRSLAAVSSLETSDVVLIKQEQK